MCGICGPQLRLLPHAARARADGAAGLDLEPLIEDDAMIPSSPGTGVEWDKRSVRRYLVG